MGTVVVDAETAPSTLCQRAHGCHRVNLAHDCAVAHMARLLGYPARILVPGGTVDARIDGIASEGATVEVVDGRYDDAVAASAR